MIKIVILMSIPNEFNINSSNINEWKNDIKDEWISNRLNYDYI